MCFIWHLMTDRLSICDWFYTWIHLINSIFLSPLFYVCMSRILNGSVEDALFFVCVWSLLCFALMRCCHVFSGQVPYLAFPVPAQSSDLEKMRHGWVNGKDGHWRKVNMPATKTPKVPRAWIIYVDSLTYYDILRFSLYSILYQSRLVCAGGSIRDMSDTEKYARNVASAEGYADHLKCVPLQRLRAWCRQRVSTSAALSVSQCWNCKQNLSGSYSNSQPHFTSMEGSKILNPHAMSTSTYFTCRSRRYWRHSAAGVPRNRIKAWNRTFLRHVAPLKIKKTLRFRCIYYVCLVSNAKSEQNAAFYRITQKVVVNLKVGLGFQPTETELPENNSHSRITGHAPKISQGVPTKDINIHNVDGPYMSFKTSLAKICQYQPISYHQMSSQNGGKVW